MLFEFLYTFKNSLEFTSLTIFPLTVLAFLLSVFPVVIKSYNLFSEGALSFTFLEIKFVKFCCFIVSSPSVTSKVESLIISFFCTFSLMIITSDKISFCTSLSDFLLSLKFTGFFEASPTLLYLPYIGITGFSETGAGSPGVSLTTSGETLEGASGATS